MVIYCANPLPGCGEGGRGQPQQGPVVKMRRLGLLLALSCIETAHAANVYDNCTSVAPEIVTVQVTGTFQSTTPHLGFLTNWLDLPHLPAWECTTYRDDPATPLLVGLLTQISPSIYHPVFEHEGATYTIYQAGPLRNRVGYIIRQRPSLTPGMGQPHDWRALNTANTNPTPDLNNPASDKMQSFTVLNAHETDYTVSIETQVRLLKWDPAGTQFPTSEFLIPPWTMASFMWWSQTIGGQFGNSPAPQKMTLRPRRLSVINATFTPMATNSCNTPQSTTITLPTLPKAEFDEGPGSTRGNTPFELELTGCDMNLTSIGYRLIAPSQNLAYPGTLVITGSASGVGLQVRHGNGDTATFGQTLTPVPGYSPGDFTATVPLQVRYIQTAAAVTPGTVAATMIVTYVYN